MAKKEDLAGDLLADIKSGFSSFKVNGSASYMDDANVNVGGWLSTGSWILDLILSNRIGVGGIPVGRLTEISGGEGAGKSLMAYYIMADCQKKGGISVYIDTEHSGTIDLMRGCGVDTSKLIWVEVETVEEVFKTMDSIANNIKKGSGKEKPPICIVWDSVAASPCKSEVEGDYGTSIIAPKARLLSAGLRKFMATCSNHQVYLVFINQLREKIGVMFGDNKVTPGGRAIPFHASVRLRLTHYKEIKDANKDKIGRIVKCDIKKNKVAPPMRVVYYYLRWGDRLGAWIDEVETTWDAAIRASVITKKNNVKYKFFSESTGEEVEFTKKQFADLWKEESFNSELKLAVSKAYIISNVALDADGVVIEDAEKGADF